jgi:AAA family ATP:ADP antiporter
MTGEPGTTPDARSPRGLGRVLRVFADVRSGEDKTALILLVNAFLLLLAYYFVKPARDGLLATAGVQGISKTELKAYTSFGQGLLLLGVIPVYASLSRTLKRRVLVTRVTLFFASNLVVFWLLQPGFLVQRVPYLGIAFYLWVGIFNVLAVAQFWSFCADIYTEERGKRLFPMIAVGASAGAAGGAWIAGLLVTAKILDTYSLLLAAGCILVISLLLTRWADARGPVGEGVPESPRATAGRVPAPSWGRAFQLIFSTRYLLATALLIMMLNWVNTNGENLLFGSVQNVLQDHVQKEGLTDPQQIEKFIADRTTAFYGNFYYWVNLVGLLLQLFVASRILRYGGFSALLLTMPAISLLSYSAMALLPVLGIIKAMKIAENATDYSINNTAKQVLWLPTTREMKYEAKGAIDTLFVRMGDGCAAVTAFVGVNQLALGFGPLFGFNVVLVLAWIALAVVVVRENRKLAAT